MRVDRFPLSALALLAGLLGSADVLAQDEPRHIVAVSPQSLVVAPMAAPLLDDMPKPTDVIRMTSFSLLAASVRRSGKTVDVTSLEADYDCSKVNRWRSIAWLGFQLGKGPSVASGEGDGVWNTGQAESIEAALWSRACHPVPTSFVPLADDVTTQAGREKALKDYRLVLPLIREGFRQ